MAGAIPRNTELHYCGLDSLHVVVLDDMHITYTCTCSIQNYKINVFLYFHAVNSKGILLGPCLWYHWFALIEKDGGWVPLIVSKE